MCCLLGLSRVLPTHSHPSWRPNPRASWPSVCPQRSSCGPGSRPRWSLWAQRQEQSPWLPPSPCASVLPWEGLPHVPRFLPGTVHTAGRVGGLIKPPKRVSGHPGSRGAQNTLWAILENLGHVPRAQQLVTHGQGCGGRTGVSAPPPTHRATDLAPCLVQAGTSLPLRLLWLPFAPQASRASAVGALLPRAPLPCPRWGPAIVLVHLGVSS